MLPLHHIRILKTRGLNTENSCNLVSVKLVTGIEPATYRLQVGCSSS
jgi:hypothetical protein